MSSSNKLTNFIKIGTAGKDDNNKRTDRIIRTIIQSLPLGSIYKEIRHGRIRINGEKTDCGNRINTGDSVYMHNSLAKIVKNDIEKIISKNENKTNNFELKKLKLEILFENDSFIAINKPSGILTHAGLKTKKNKQTLDDVIKEKFINESNKSLAFSPAPLHRLDKESSGIVFFSKSIEGARIFTSFLREKKFIKKYITVLVGHLPKSCTWKDVLLSEDKKSSGAADKEAITHIKPLLYSAAPGATSTLALVEIETGRHRQIRKQCSMHGFPLLGDKKYGSSASILKNITGKHENNTSFLLHFWKIDLKDKEEREKLGFNTITAAPPDLFIETISALFGKENVDKIFEIYP